MNELKRSAKFAGMGIYLGLAGYITQFGEMTGYNVFINGVFIGGLTVATYYMGRIHQNKTQEGELDEQGEQNE